MKKIFNIMDLFRTILFSTALVLSLGGQAHAAYNDAGTDYTTASSGSWIEDASKQALNMVNAFVCIIKNSNGDSRPNGTWRILIDEVACGLNEEDSVAWADQIAVSTRASNDSDQEVVSYFNTADGSKYVATTTLNESLTSDYGLTMLFKWYNAYDVYGEGANLTSTGYLDGASNAFGFSEITVEDYDSDGTDDTVIRTAETFGDGTLGGIVVNYGGTPDGAATAFLVSAPDYSSGDGGSVTYAGALSDTEYLRQVYDSDAESFGGDTCYTNQDPFQSVYRYGVYDSDTGEELAISGSFGFTYETGGVSGESGRGFLGHWGVWFDNRSDKLSSSNTSLAITNEDTEDALVINWSPGKMWQKDSSEVTLSDGEKFEFYDWSSGTRTNVTWSETNGDFYDFDGVRFVYPLDNTPTSIAEGDWFYSERFNTWVGFLGANVGGDFEIYVEKNTNVKSHWDGTGSQGIDVSGEVDFICASNCPNANIPVAEYTGYVFNDDLSNAGDTYILTPFNESRSGIYPLALYKDTVAASNLVSFDPSGDWSSNTHAHIWTGNFIPTNDLDVGTCSASTDPSEVNNMYNCPNLFVWESGLREWGQGIVVTNSADGSAVTIQDPIQFTYTHAAANDRNNANYATEAGAPFNYTWVETDWSDPSGSQTTTSSTFGVDLVDGVSLNLEYEGVGQLHGFMERQTPNGWMKLMNLADGTEITRVSDSSTYVVKALDTGLLLNTQACSGDLSVPAAFQNLSIIPAPTSKSKPSQIFNNAPTVTSIHVKQGEDLIDPSLVQANE
ncbi:MAG: hypothetical protein O3C54_04115 [Proteobacteria bacterium]|nr:hypothetical protein [Pseudomonadota bacterium]